MLLYASVRFPFAAVGAVAGEDSVVHGPVLQFPGLLEAAGSP